MAPSPQKPATIGAPAGPMRILFLTEGYPPSTNGGYEQLCEEVAEHLAQRGHAVHVLTTKNCVATTSAAGVSSLLELEIDPQRGGTARQFWFGRRVRELQNIAALDATIQQFQPDVAYVWNVRNLPRCLLHHLEQSGLPVVYYIAYYWPILPDMFTGYWRSKPRPVLKRWAKSLAALPAQLLMRWEGKPFPLQFEQVHCVSQAVLTAMQQAGIEPHQAQVIHNGIDLTHFSARPRIPHSPSCPLRALYAGRITQEKGADTLVDALCKHSDDETLNEMTVTLVGDGPAEFVDMLQQQVRAAHLTEVIHFQSAVARAQMPEIMQGYDILIFPSREEALPRIVQEAMAMGLAVVGTTVGGTAELLREGETGLTFAPGDAMALAHRLKSMLRDEELRRRLAKAGREMVEKHFAIEPMIDTIENALHRTSTDRMSLSIQHRPHALTASG